MIKHKHILLKIFIFIFIYTWSTFSLSQSLNGIGYIDKVNIDNSNSSIEIIGWVGTLPRGSQHLGFNVLIGDENLEVLKFERFERPDVISVYPNNEWINSGFKLIVNLPDKVVNGRYELKVKAIINDKNIINITNSENNKFINIKKNNDKKIKITIFWLFIVLGSLFLFIYFKYHYYILIFFNSNKYFTFNTIVTTNLIFLLSFLIFVSLGVTGSSYDLLFKNDTFIDSDSRPLKIAFNQQSIRSDEWMAFTPLMIAQYNHEPKFPVINSRLGADGQNMLVTSIGIVPIAHITAFAKPPTWGFFIFDLSSALAWAWWSPFFLCLSGLWWLYRIVLLGNLKISLFLALLYSLSANCFAWSGWTQYAVAAPAIAFCSFYTILIQKRNIYLFFILFYIIIFIRSLFVMFVMVTVMFVMVTVMFVMFVIVTFSIS